MANKKKKAAEEKAPKKIYIGIIFCRSTSEVALAAAYFKAQSGFFGKRELGLFLQLFVFGYKKLGASGNSLSSVLFSSHSHGFIIR